MLLDALPTELVWAIDEHLGAAYAARLALRLTSRSLRYRLLPRKLPVPTRSLCEVIHLRRWWADEPDRSFCALCKMWYPRSLFTSSNAAVATTDQRARHLESASSPTEAKRLLADGFGPLGGPGALDVPPGCCIAHRSLLIRDITSVGGGGGARPWLKTDDDDSPSAFPPPSPPRWLRTTTLLCLHCGQLRDSLGLRGSCGCGDSRCETCGERVVEAFVRRRRRQRRRVEEEPPPKLTAAERSAVGSEWTQSTAQSEADLLASTGYVVYRMHGLAFVREWFDAEGDGAAVRELVSIGGNANRVVVRHGRPQIAVDFEVQRMESVDDLW